MKIKLSLLQACWGHWRMLQAMQKIDDTGRADLFSFESDYLFFYHLEGFFWKEKKR